MNNLQTFIYNEEPLQRNIGTYIQALAKLASAYFIAKGGKLLCKVKKGKILSGQASKLLAIFIFTVVILIEKPIKRLVALLW